MFKIIITKITGTPYQRIILPEYAEASIDLPRQDQLKYGHNVDDGGDGEWDGHGSDDDGNETEIDEVNYDDDADNYNDMTLRQMTKVL